MSKEETTGTPFFQDLEGVGVWEPNEKSILSNTISKKSKAYPKQMLLAGGRAPRASWWALQIADIRVGYRYTSSSDTS